MPTRAFGCTARSRVTATFIYFAPVVALAAAAPMVSAAPPRPLPGYVVLLDRHVDPAFRDAAERLARFHDAAVRVFDPADLAALRRVLLAEPPRYVAIVAAPATLDVAFTHAWLEMAIALDDDPFVDFEYAFITGRDGPAAAAFVDRVIAAWDRAPGDRAVMFGSWEGPVLPPPQPLTALRALGFKGEQHYVLAKADEAQRRETARAALTALRGADALLFFSHGYPDEMCLCYSAADLREWNVDLAPAVLVNCACYNGAPFLWWKPQAGGFAPQQPVSPDRAVALAVLDSGVSAYVAGIDAWHGPLAMQYFNHLAGDGMRLGEAAKRMHDRLALAFAPDPIRYPPPDERGPLREGRENRRWNGGAMIVYGDPAYAPFATRDSRPLRAACARGDDESLRITLELPPLLAGPPAADFMLPQARILDYYSVQTGDVLKELSLELHGVVDWPVGAAPVSLHVKSAVCGAAAVPTAPPQTALEQTPDGPRLHVRVPLAARAFGTTWTMDLAMRGITIELTTAP